MAAVNVDYSLGRYLVLGLLIIILVIGAILWYKSNSQSCQQFKSEARKWGIGLTIGSAGVIVLGVAWEAFSRYSKSKGQGEAAAALLA